MMAPPEVIQEYSNEKKYQDTDAVSHYDALYMRR